MPRKPRDHNAPKDYEVGYGKPPTHSQFQKKQSGNRLGRPKGAKGLKTYLEEALAKHISHPHTGKRIPKAALTAEAMVNESIRGNVAAFTAIMRATGGPGDDTGPAAAAALDLTPDEEALLLDYLSRRAAANKRGGE